MGWCHTHIFLPMSDRVLMKETKADNETKQPAKIRFYTDRSGHKCVNLYIHFNLIGSELHEANKCFPSNGFIVNTP